MAKKIKTITKTRNLKNTKVFMVFFVVSFFRDFVIKDLFLFRFIRVGSVRIWVQTISSF